MPEDEALNKRWGDVSVRRVSKGLDECSECRRKECGEAELYAAVRGAAEGMGASTWPGSMEQRTHRIS